MFVVCALDRNKLQPLCNTEKVRAPRLTNYLRTVVLNSLCSKKYFPERNTTIILKSNFQAYKPVDPACLETKDEQIITMVLKIY